MVLLFIYTLHAAVLFGYLSVAVEILFLHNVIIQVELVNNPLKILNYQYQM